MDTTAAATTSDSNGPDDWADVIDEKFWATQAEELLATAHVVALKIIYALVILIIGWIVIKIVMFIVRKVLTRVKVDGAVKSFACSILNFFLWMVLWLQIFKILNIPNTSFTAVMSALAFALGMALSGILNNVLAGLVILTFKPFIVGDFITGGGAEGVVTEITLTNTIVRTGDGKRCLVPNLPLATEIITNTTKNTTRRVDMTFGVDHNADMVVVRKLLTKIATKNALVLKEPAPVINPLSLEPSFVIWVVRPWCNTSDYFTVLTDITTEIKAKFDEAGISLSYPQRDIHVFRQEGGAAIKDGLGDDNKDESEDVDADTESEEEEAATEEESEEKPKKKAKEDKKEKEKAKEKESKKKK